ncbi:MAG: tyrosine-type recombinase/integrase [Nocardioides sp.]
MSAAIAIRPGARTLDQDLKRRIVEGVLGPEEPASELDLALEDFGAWLQRRGMSRATRQARTSMAGLFFRAHGRWDVSGEEVAGWLEGYDGWTRVTYQQHLVATFAWLVEIGHVDESPMPMIRRGRQPRRRPNPLTPDDFDRVMRAATTRDERAWLMLGALAGLRCHEIAKLHGRDVSEQLIRVVGKGGVDASVPTHPAVWTLAQEYPSDGYWFTSRMPGEHVSGSCVSNRIAAVMRSVGLPGSIHRARHTFATNLLRGGVNIRVVQELMRHSSIETTARYLLVVEDEMMTAVHALIMAPR